MTAQLTAYPVFRALDANGVPLSGGLLYSYAAGTTTPLATYTTELGNAANTNPVVLDSTGSANVWLSAVPYKLVLKDYAGNIQFTVDNVQPAPGNVFGALNISSASTVTLTNPLATAIQANLTTTGKGLNLPAVNVAGGPGLGVPFLISASGNALTVYAQDGITSIVAIPAGGSAIISLIDNSTANGTWIVDLAANAGYGLIVGSGGAIKVNVGSNISNNSTGQLVAVIPSYTPTTTTYNLTDADRGKKLTGGFSTQTYVLPDTSIVGDGWYCWFHNAGVNNTSTINSFTGGTTITTPKAGAVSTLSFAGNYSFIMLVTSGGSYQAIAGSSDLV